jgi:hypothetical protein
LKAARRGQAALMPSAAQRAEARLPVTKATPFVRLGAAGHACTETFADVPDLLCSVSVMSCMWIVVGRLVRCAMGKLTHAGPNLDA